MSTSAVSYEFFATCAAGFEQLLAGELSSLEISSIRALRGQVAFSATLAEAYRACLWSRIASRVELVLGRGDAADDEQLYQTINAIAWEEHLPLDATFAVSANGTNENLRNTQYVSVRAKDAICDRLVAKVGGRPSVDTRYHDLLVEVRLRGDRVTVSLDFSGLLFKRNGYSGSGNFSFMRPDYAAALLAAGGWYRCCRREHPVLVSTFSGSGLLLCEAAALALDRAPGMYQTKWGFERWLGHDASLWSALLAEAEIRAESGKARGSELTLIALDNRHKTASAARQMLRSQGFDIEVKTLADVNNLSSELAQIPGLEPDALLMAIDLSAREATDQARELDILGFVAQAVGVLPQDALFAALATSTTLDAMLGHTPQTTYDTIIGRDEGSIRVYQKDAQAQGNITTLELKNGARVPVLVPASDQFAARLTKVAKLRRKWAAREDISCYRVYDTDLPDYAVAIDLYQASAFESGYDKNKRWLVVQEYAAPKTVDQELAHKRLLDVLSIAPRVLDIEPNNVFVRVRKHDKGGSQYADGGKSDIRRSKDFGRNDKRSSKGSKGTLALPRGAHRIDEGGLVFEVNFTERLDTGIFLDHRDVRAEVREMAKKTLGSKRFLNLFAYTGTATCYAADGGAKHTTTVDLSQTYLDWAQRNMAYNGFTGDVHEYVQDDVVRWVAQQRHTANRWDLVFCDPPTFSNSKRMGKQVFDVQRDHAELLIGISRLLTRNGVCLFSCNLRGFKPDVEKLARAGVEISDVTEGTIPEDFARNAKIHHCYLVKRTPRDEG